MPSTPVGYQRRNTLRHPGHDYTQPGAYFVTICAYSGRCLFGQIESHTMVLNPLGQVAVITWHQFVERHDIVTDDAFVVMPNHVHLLMWLGHDPILAKGAGEHPNREFGKSIAGSLSTLVGAYKGSVTQQAMNSGLVPGRPLWQDNFYDHIVRNDVDLQRIRDYIRMNPARWVRDQLNPTAPPNHFNRTWHRSP